MGQKSGWIDGASGRETIGDGGSDGGEAGNAR
jgi:hypothetical protein